MSERTTVVLRSLTNGVHALPIRSNAADPKEREANPGVVLVGIEPTPVLLTEAERLVCEAIPGLVELVQASDEPETVQAPEDPPAPPVSPEPQSDTPPEADPATGTEPKPVWLGDGLGAKPSKSRK